MKALVTGASGFVGSTLCEELARRGVEPKVLVRKNLGNLVGKRFIPVGGDLRNPESLAHAVEDVDTVFHVAGVVSAKTKEDFFASNAQGTKNLIEAATKYGKSLKRFVLVSSLAAAGPSTPEKTRVEWEENSPVSFYGESKLAGEVEALRAKEKFEVVVVRPPAVYGPRDKGILTFFEFIQKGILPILGTENPDPHRYSFVHVDDLVQGIVLAGTASVKSGEIFYLAGDGEFSWEEAMRMIAKGLGKKTMDLRLPIPLLTGVAAICTGITKVSGKVLPFSLDKIKEIKAPAWTCSNKKAKKELGFTPYWDLARGLEQTGKWYRENGWL